jgi:hypothetical protein
LPTATSVASRSIDQSASRSLTPAGARSQTPGGAHSQISTGAMFTKKEILINKLQFDRALTTEDHSAGLRVYYQRYEAVLAARLSYENLRKAGNWDANFIPTTVDFYELVTSRSMWYKQYRLFEQVSRYPRMIKWLKESEDSATNSELWGFDRDIYQWAHLARFLKHDGKPLEDSEDESDEEKANAKKKKTHKKAKPASSSRERSESESEKKKTQKKANTRNRSRAKAKAASASGEESEVETASAKKSYKKNVASGSRKR